MKILAFAALSCAALIAQTTDDPVYNRSFEIYDPQNHGLADRWRPYGGAYARICGTTAPWDGPCVARLSANTGASQSVSFNQSTAKPVRITARVKVTSVADDPYDTLGASIDCRIVNTDGTTSFPCIKSQKTKNVGTYQYWTLIGFNTWSNGITKPAATAEIRLRMGNVAGTAHVDDVHAEQYTPLDDPPVAIVADDTFLSHHTKLFPLLKAYGFPCSLATVWNYIGTPGHMTLDQIREMRSYGCTVLDHSLKHDDQTTLTDSELRNDIYWSHKHLVDAGLDPKHYATPFGGYNARVLYWLQHERYNGKAFLSVRNTDGPYSPQGVFPYNVFSYSIKSTDTVDTINALLRESLARRSGLILNIHEIDNPNGAYTIPYDTLNQMLFAIKNSGRPVVTYDRAFEMLTAK